MSALLRSKPCAMARPAAQRRSTHITMATTAGPRVAAATLAASVLLLGSQSAHAIGIESFNILPDSFEKPASLSAGADASKSKLAQADEAFEKSDTLKELLARSEANKAKNKKEIQNKYCFRQAELGVGDCGGLRYIPGLTENGKQKAPQWLNDFLGVEAPAADAVGGKTLRELIYDDK